MRICLIASSRYPIRQPFAGGLESLTHTLAAELSRRGHEVSLFAAPGSDPELPVQALPMASFAPSAVAMSDVNTPQLASLLEHHAYLGLMLELAAHGAERFDVVHNNSLHHLPVAMAPALPVPMITTLHTPPVPWLESAIALAPDTSVFAAVSGFTQSAWSHVVPSTRVLNGVDTAAWSPGTGGGPAVWVGRLVPEKAPHLAIDAAREAGIPIVLAGPMSDPAYAEREVRPRLGADARYLGHLDRDALVEVLGAASAAVVTPAWDEPYGLVAAEALACGTPVACFSRGALPELVVPGVGALARPDDPTDLARAIDEALLCDRDVVRRHAVAACSLTRMIEEYEALYRLCVEDRAAA
jgi:glycosyltransferase involved in cell wall biosynthesis